MVKGTKAQTDVIPDGVQSPTAEPQPVDLPQAGLSPVVVAPALTEITVSVKVTIPLLSYGNTEIFVSQKYITRDDYVSREQATIAGIDALKSAITQAVLPMVEAEVERARPALVVERSPDVWMQQKNSVYRWFRVFAPDAGIPAMEAIILDPGRSDRATS